MLVVGIAGPAGSGKSTVCRLLSRRPGFSHLDCDEIVKDTYAPGGPAYREVVEAFGEGILTMDGAIDRRRLAELVLPDPEKRKRLEEIVHPLVVQIIRKRIEEERGRGTEVLLVEGVLLLHSPHVPRELFDLAVWLEAPEEVRRKRLLSAGIPPEVVALRLTAQRDLSPPPWAEVVDASRPPDEVARAVAALIEKREQRGDLAS
ncbi:dephospho-CoA kinase [Candidatus Bipolaricaulota sp. J31]